MADLLVLEFIITNIGTITCEIDAAQTFVPKLHVSPYCKSMWERVVEMPMEEPHVFGEANQCVPCINFILRRKSAIFPEVCVVCLSWILKRLKLAYRWNEHCMPVIEEARCFDEQRGESQGWNKSIVVCVWKALLLEKGMDVVGKFADDYLTK